MICTCAEKDFARMFQIINDAARAYEGKIPDDCYHQPYMPEVELRQEMKRVTFFGWEEGGELLGVMGLEPIKGVKLIRHAYVSTGQQNKGIGSQLLKHIKGLYSGSRLLVGTWADAHWAIDFYKKHGFRLCENKDELLDSYWDISPRQTETSVVLELV